MVRFIAVLMAAACVARAAPDDPLKTLRPSHPRLLAADSDLERIRILVQQNPQARKLHGDLIKEAEKMLAAPVLEYRLAGPRFHAAKPAVPRAHLYSGVSLPAGRQETVLRASRA